MLKRIQLAHIYIENNGTAEWKNTFCVKDPILCSPVLFIFFCETHKKRRLTEGLSCSFPWKGT